MIPCRRCIESGSFILDWFGYDYFALFTGALKKGHHFHMLFMPVFEESSELVSTDP